MVWEKALVTFEIWRNRKLRRHENDGTAAFIWLIFSLRAFFLRPWASVVKKTFSPCIFQLLSASFSASLSLSHFLSLFCLPVPLCFLSHSPDFLSVQRSQDKCQRQYYCVLSCHHSLCYVRHCCVCVCVFAWLQSWYAFSEFTIIPAYPNWCQTCFSSTDVWSVAVQPWPLVKCPTCYVLNG